jgi:hypothetical protein
MTGYFAAVGGKPVQELLLDVPEAGCWMVDALMAESVDLSGRVTVTLGSSSLVGTVDPTASGDWQASRRVRIVSGAGGWGRIVLARAYHSDLGVRAITVAQDLAASVGETLGTFAPSSERVGVDFVREASPASDVLETVAHGVPWWVDYQGVTHVARRPEAPAGTYRLLGWDTRSRIATLSVDDPAAIGIGTVLTDRLDAPQTVRAYRVSLGKDSLRVDAWCGGEAGTVARAARSIAAIARKAVGGRLRGRYRYRVSRQLGDRYQLEPVRGDLGLPPIGPVSARPGIAGAWASVSRGTEVVVSFLDDGDPAWPVVEGFAPKGSECFVPKRLELCVGPGETGAGISGVGNTISVFFPDLVPFEGLINGVTPITGTITILTPGVGIIEDGSDRVVRG